MPTVVKPKPVQVVAQHREFDLEEFERFLLYTKQCRPFNTSRIMVYARHLVTNYKIAFLRRAIAWRTRDKMFFI